MFLRCYIFFAIFVLLTLPRPASTRALPRFLFGPITPREYEHNPVTPTRSRGSGVGELFTSLLLDRRNHLCFVRTWKSPREAWRLSTVRPVAIDEHATAFTLFKIQYCLKDRTLGNNRSLYRQSYSVVRSLIDARPCSSQAFSDLAKGNAWSHCTISCSTSRLPPAFTRVHYTEQ